MKKMKVNGDVVRKEREKRAWTQEELSERSQLGVRTLRRLEAGQASPETIKRVAEALELEPRAALSPESTPIQNVRPFLHFDPLTLELATDLVDEAFIKVLLERIVSIRPHIAGQLGFPVPGIRVRDRIDIAPGSYRIMVREVLVQEVTIHPRYLLAIGKDQSLDGLEGIPGQDPTYGMPGRWIDPTLKVRAEAQGAMVFDLVSVIATHLTETIKVHAARLLGIEEVAQLLEWLPQAQLKAQVIPGRVTLITLRAILRDLLSERVSIRDLPLILETLADHADLDRSPEELTEIVRTALAPSISQDYANSEGQIVAVVVEGPTVDRERLIQEGQRQAQREMLPIFVTPPELRRQVRNLLQGKAGWVALATSEISPPVVLHPVATIGPLL